MKSDLTVAVRYAVLIALCASTEINREFFKLIRRIKYGGRRVTKIFLKMRQVLMSSWKPENGS
jgi:hypothetical protein